MSITCSFSIYKNIPYIVDTLGNKNSTWIISIFSICSTLTFIFVRKKIHNTLKFLSKKALDKFKLYDTLTYSPFLLSLGLFGPFRATWSLAILILVIFIVLQFLLLSCIIKEEDKEKILTSNHAVPVVFLLSGFAALIYQIIWQKELLSTYGVNSETITIIVAVFMAGLGFGALSSNLIARAFNYNYLRAFLFIELIIGIYGIFSLKIIELLATELNQSSLADIILQSLLCVLVPTFLMGATLPILVSYLTKHLTDIGKAVGRLYAFNTFGSAIAAFLTVGLILVVTGKQNAIFIAAGFNFLTAWLVYIMSKYLHKKHTTTPQTAPQRSISLSSGGIISLLVGYIALSQEILLFRMADFSNGNSASTFGILLSLYLLGIALGSLKAESIISKSKNYILFITRNLFICFVVFYFIPPLILNIDFLNKDQIIHNLPYFIALCSAYLTGSILPIISQTVKTSKKGFHYIYALNILGAVLGTIITGYYSFQYLGMANNILLISYILLFTIFFLSLYLKRIYTFIICFVMTIPVLTHNNIYNNFLEKIQYTYVSPELYPFEHVIENRHGIITVMKEGDSHIVLGGGLYDGKINTDFNNKTNSIFRAYATAMLHRNPKDVLVIGLSGGSWTKVLTDYKPIKNIDILELNEGYIDVIKKIPGQDAVLSNKKNHFYFDDGALWLKKTTKRYDFILMNTTWYWRNGINNLLSKEFLELAKAHLNPGGVLYYNSTNCNDVPYTAAHVFKYITKIRSFIAVSDSPFDLTEEEKKYNLSLFVNKNQDPLIDFNSSPSSLLINELIELTSLDVRDQYLNSNKHHWLITKDNLANEFKYDQHFLSSERYGEIKSKLLQRYNNYLNLWKN